MEITKEEVEKVAKLARLELSPSEVPAMAAQLSQILVYVQTLRTYDTEGVEPTATVLGQVNVFRDDRVEPSLSTADALANAPQTEGQAFLVPKII
ncbi:MAG TPA: Asp-tRNA(Asn)/Glu-tRNA(Gln) amidotransferase subunit GatC [Nitrospiraceae bacterium]|jgi:aspartyl-tRNA(Asn)/glutamyl-tRNA(Gln) amidotransferase subunit C|nr:Asp-tRNA(Asn)/Glu-tRNA(Gln) amidotransferase subunit GatC [Nitrospiraceae bacterium]